MGILRAWISVGGSTKYGSAVSGDDIQTAENGVGFNTAYTASRHTFRHSIKLMLSY